MSGTAIAGQTAGLVWSGPVGWGPASGHGLYPHCGEEGRARSCIWAAMQRSALRAGSTPGCCLPCEGAGLLSPSFIPSPFGTWYVAGRVGSRQVFSC